MSRHEDRLEMLASDLASRYGEQDELVRNVRMSIDARKDVRSPKSRFTTSTPLKTVGTSAAVGSQHNAPFRRP